MYIYDYKVFFHPVLSILCHYILYVVCVCIGHLKLNKLCGDYNKKLKIFKADPFDYHSIVEALRGCSGLFYTFEAPQDQTTYDVCSLILVTVIIAR